MAGHIDEMGPEAALDRDVAHAGHGEPLDLQ